MMETLPFTLRMVGAIVAIVIIIAGRRNKDFTKVSVSEVDHPGSRRLHSNPSLDTRVLG